MLHAKPVKQTSLKSNQYWVKVKSPQNSEAFTNKQIKNTISTQSLLNRWKHHLQKFQQHIFLP